MRKSLVQPGLPHCGDCGRAAADAAAPGEEESLEVLIKVCIVLEDLLEEKKGRRDYFFSRVSVGIEPR